jgi:hypothetical protein
MVLFGWGVPGLSDAYAKSARIDTARKMCRQYAKQQDVTLDLASWGPATAGAVAKAGRALGVDVSPWNEFPAKHVLALCGFGPVATRLQVPTPTTVCPNGKVIHTMETFHVIVDRTGRSSPNHLDDVFPPLLDLCA